MRKSIRNFFLKWLSLTNTQKSEIIGRKLAIVYGVVGWNCFGFLFYTIMKERLPEDDMGRRLSYKRLTGGTSNLEVYQVRGFNQLNTFSVTDDSDIYKEGEETE